MLFGTTTHTGTTNEWLSELRSSSLACAIHQCSGVSCLTTRAYRVRSREAQDDSPSWPAAPGLPQHPHTEQQQHMETRTDAKRARFTVEGQEQQRDSMASLSDDVLHQVVCYSTAADLCRLQAVSRRMQSHALSETVWKALAGSGGFLREEQVPAAMQALQLSTHQQLVEVLTRVGIPGGVLGYWRAEIPSPFTPAPLSGEAGAGAAAAAGLAASAVQMYDDMHAPHADPKGELLCISLVPGGFLCESIGACGTHSAVFRVRVTERKARGSNNRKGVRVVIFPLESEFKMGGAFAMPRPGAAAVVPPALAGFAAAQRLASIGAPPARPGGVVLRRDRNNNSNGGGFSLLRGNTMRTYVRVDVPGAANAAPAPEPAALAAAAAAAGADPAFVGDAVGRLSGLWSAPYGRHGLEVLQVSVETSPPGGGSPSSASPAAAAEAGPPASPRAAGPVLVGSKVVGDPNVPAGKVSFDVDLSKEYDPDVELVEDPRPVACFLPGGAVVGDLATRRPAIARWLKGRGHVNRSARGEWVPEVGEVDVLVYHAAGEGPGVATVADPTPIAFSVVWKEPGEAVRIVVDFRRLKGSKIPPPNWGGSGLRSRLLAASQQA